MILALDPSINDVGCAIVDSSGQYVSGSTLKTKGKSTAQKLDSLVAQFSAWFSQQKNIDTIVIEHTRFFARQNNQSHASAQKLNLAKGVLFGLAKSLHPGPVHLIWMAGFNKDQARLIARACKLPEKISQHEVDAFWLAYQWSTATAAKKRELIEADLDT